MQSLSYLSIILKARNNFLIFTNLTSSNPQFKSLELRTPPPPIKCVIYNCDVQLTETVLSNYRYKK